MKSLQPSISWEEEVAEAYKNAAQFPFPIYASAYQNGEFLHGNKQAVDFFGFADEEEMKKACMTDYYYNVSERGRVLQIIRDTPKDQWSRRVRVRLKVNGKLRRVYFVSRVFCDRHGHPQAMLCMALNVADSEWFAGFEEETKDGLFEATNYRISDCNSAFARLLGYEREELKDLHIKDLLWPTESYPDLIERIQRQHTLKRYPLRLRRSSGEMLIVELSCNASFNGDGAANRVSGIVSNVLYETIHSKLPVGVFLISTDENGKEIIAHANEVFAKLLGYNDIRDVLSLPIRQFHPNEAAYQSFKKALNEEADKKRPLLDFYMEVCDCLGQRRNVVANVCYLDNQDRKVRVGIVYDLTGHINEQLRTLKNNFGAILHTYIATVAGLRRSLEWILRATGEDVLLRKSAVDYERLQQQRTGILKRLSSNFELLYQTAMERGYDNNSLILKLKDLLNKLFRELNIAHGREKDNASIIRQLSIKIRDTLTSIDSDTNISKEPIRRLRAEIAELLRLSNVVTLATAYNELGERILDFNYFRDYLRGEPTRPEDFKLLNLTRIVLEVVSSLAEFAALRQVDIRREFSPQDLLPIQGHRSLLNRALHSLLHNAIKYTWSKGEERRSWVTVRIEKIPVEEQVRIIIENRGVPIRKEEVESGSIFHFGVRGKEADDRNRSGTGIGLFDAKEIIQQHGGTLTLTSEPVSGNLPEIYTNPFMTRVYIKLPIAKDA